MANLQETLRTLHGFLTNMHRMIESLHGSQATVDSPGAMAESILSDEEIARLEQERLYLEPPIDVSTVPLYNSHVTDDMELARRLQEEEYSKPSILIHHNRSSSGSSHNDDDDDAIQINDAALAEHLQAAENRRQERRRARARRPLPPPIRPTIHQAPPAPIIPVAIRPARNLRFPRGGQNPLHRIFSNIRNPSMGPFADLLARNDDFTPEDYERLMELDAHAQQQPKLNDEQIRTFPTEKFVRRPHQTDQDITCSICWEKYEAEDTLRRLPCMHTFHRDCIDRWLKTKSECPICRVAPA